MGTLALAGIIGYTEVEQLFSDKKTPRLLSYANPLTQWVFKERINMGDLTFASHTQYGPEGEQIMVAEQVSRLFSFASPQTKPLLSLYQARAERLKLYLDSGAYSVFTKGLTLSLDDYCAFIEATRDIWTLWFNLDVIPGSPGVPPTDDQAKAAAEASLNNWRMMRKRGLPSVPVFHLGEPLDLLKEMIKEVQATKAETGFLALGGLAMAAPQRRFEWLRDTVWPLLLKPDGTSKVKVHGLGITDQLTATAFPWASIDSSSWIRWVIAGRMAYWRDGKLYALPVSERHRKGWHHFSGAEKDSLRATGEFPEDFEAWSVKDQYLYITKLNVQAVKLLEAMIPDKVQPIGKARTRMW